MDEGDREPAQDRATVSPVSGEGAEDHSQERVGPLLLSRYRKRDERALLLYERVEGASQGE